VEVTNIRDVDEAVLHAADAVIAGEMGAQSATVRYHVTMRDLRHELGRRGYEPVRVSGVAGGWQWQHTGSRAMRAFTEWEAKYLSSAGAGIRPSHKLPAPAIEPLTSDGTDELPADDFDLDSIISDIQRAAEQAEHAHSAIANLQQQLAEAIAQRDQAHADRARLLDAVAQLAPKAEKYDEIRNAEKRRQVQLSHTALREVSEKLARQLRGTDDRTA
jgi:hypothetical protein